MMTGAHYGQIIKHLETTHLDALPVPVVCRQQAEKFQARAQEILDLRNCSCRLTREAEEHLEQVVGPVTFTQRETGFVTRASAFLAKRRRLEAAYHAPSATDVLRRFSAAGAKIDLLSSVTKRVWWMSRFRRFYGDEGIPYLSADEFFTTNPTESKRILIQAEDSHEEYFVKRGWLIMACSGQVYGLNGAVRLATEYHEGTFFSHDLIRIVPNPEKIRGGYLLTTLTHPRLGRPVLIREAYGTSIPHLDPGDVSDFPVVRLSAADENIIADLAEASGTARAKADILDREIAEEAGKLVDRFLAGELTDFIVSMSAFGDS